MSQTEHVLEIQKQAVSNAVDAFLNMDTWLEKLIGNIDGIVLQTKLHMKLAVGRITKKRIKSERGL